MKNTYYQLIGPKEIFLTIDGVEVATYFYIVACNCFREPFVIGRNDLSKRGIKATKKGDTAIGLDYDSTVLIPFESADGVSMLKRLVDTGAGASIMSQTAWKKLNLPIELEEKYCHFVAANNQPIETFGLAPSVKFNNAGLELESSFIIGADMTE